MLGIAAQSQPLRDVFFEDCHLCGGRNRVVADGTVVSEECHTCGHIAEYYQNAGQYRTEKEMTRKTTIKLYDPEAEVLHPEPLTIAESTGFASWTPQQWAVFFVAAATFIASVVNIVSGNPVGIPFAG